MTTAQADAIHAYVIDGAWKAYNKEHGRRKRTEIRLARILRIITDKPIFFFFFQSVRSVANCGSVL
jgi:hypothetical protein